MLLLLIIMKISFLFIFYFLAFFLMVQLWTKFRKEKKKDVKANSRWVCSRSSIEWPFFSRTVGLRGRALAVTVPSMLVKYIVVQSWEHGHEESRVPFLLLLALSCTSWPRRGTAPGVGSRTVGFWTWWASVSEPLENMGPEGFEGIYLFSFPLK